MKTENNMKRLVEEEEQTISIFVKEAEGFLELRYLISWQAKIHENLLAQKPTGDKKKEGCSKVWWRWRKSWKPLVGLDLVEMGKGGGALALAE